MAPRTLLSALCLPLLCACSTTLPSAPAKIDPPPVGLTVGRARPDDLGPLAISQDPAALAVEMIAATFANEKRAERWCATKTVHLCKRASAYLPFPWRHAPWDILQGLCDWSRIAQEVLSDRVAWVLLEPW